MTPVAKPNPWRVIAFLLGLAIAPFILTVWIGAPIPHGPPTIEQIETLLRGLTMTHWHALFRIIIWAVWLVIVVGSIWEIAAYLHGSHPTAAPARKPWFLRLTGALALGTTATTALTAATPAAAVETETGIDDAAPRPSTRDDQRSPLDASLSITSARTAPADSGKSSSYTVRTGDTLWDIATTELNDPAAWTTIYRLNKNQPQPDGDRLTDPNLIQPGWQLDLPADATDEPLPDTESPDDDQSHGDPPSKSDDKPAHDAPTPPSDSPDDSGHGPDWVWWTGGFVSAAFAAGLAIHVRNARRRVRAFEQRTGRTGPRVRLVKPLDELETTSNTDFAGIDTSQPAALGVADNGAGVSVLTAASGGLGLDGPGAEATARAAVAAALADGDQDASAPGCDVFITSPAMTQLLDEKPAPGNGIYRLWTYPSGEATLRALNREILARIRDQDAGTAPILLVVDDDVDRAVLASLIRQGEQLDIGALILGDWPDSTITVGTDGTCNDHDLARCSVLTIEAFAATLSTLDDVREAFDEPITIAPDDLDNLDAKLDQTAPDADADDTAYETSKTDTPERHDVDAEVTAADGTAGSRPPDLEPATPASPAPPTSNDHTEKPLRLRLLGDVEVAYHRDPLHIRRAKSRELLACLAAHDQAATRDYLMEAIVPETVVLKARNHLESIVTNTRKDLREATAEPNTTKFILYADHTYRLDPDWFTTDLAEFDQHIAGAAATSGHTAAHTHLTAALEIYTGEVAADVDTDSIWPHPVRAHYADLAHAACLTLAEHAASHNDDAPAIEWLERAISINRYNETAYTRLIHIHQQHGDNDNATKVYNRLKSALAAIGATPSPVSRPQPNSP